MDGDFFEAFRFYGFIMNLGIIPKNHTPYSLNSQAHAH